ncbi:relaxase/mobilization nuclease domain-containing protein [Streptomyces paludis]|uniref:Mobilization protein n=1 Tax=Streptomyces paludis TaxID=2282738 RepID=A0A345HRC1_9ACTN|nr:mobilization protein [Streptomyces paludis]AXG79245.1 mobilization protein [Streptomyces paludis]
MIAKITSGKNTAKLIGYLYGPGRANEHTDPHLVASWDGFAPDPGRTNNFKATKQRLANALDLRVKQAGDHAPDQHVWHCSVRAAPEDRLLTDDEWAAIANRVVAATGIAPDDDPDGCRWIAVRHAPDHIHIAATKVRGDLRPARHWNDYLTADRELATIEKEYGLREVVRGDRTAAPRPTRAEKEKAQRAGQVMTAREQLRTTVRTAVSIAAGPEEFLALLTGIDSMLVEIQRFPSGDIRGYKVALPDDTNAAGEPVWFSGSKLAPDLSYPKIHERLTAVEPVDRRRTNPWHQATATTERIPTHLDHGDDNAAQAHLAAFGEALDALPRLAPEHIRPQLRQAATAFERATRSRIHAEHHHARALRGAVRAMRTQPVTGDGALLAMFLDAAILAVIAATRWHDLRHHQQQTIAARETLEHLRTAYAQAAPEPLATLVRNNTPPRTVERYAEQLRSVVPAHADRITADPSWDALAGALATAEEAGHDPARILQQAAQIKPLDDARSPGEVLVWRVHRLAQRQAPSARALAAQARTTVPGATVRPARSLPSVPQPPMSAPPPQRHR